ncbi:glycosyl transferase family protein [Novosphingobium sp.]|uniref:glycosyl transferase family protein n=1 Tax=Novosphingobium sp. TaxID=1874826 RepID=UPI00273661D7|nr:glycosyl transferase family protein [Novosphingobium sp.]MDP3905825.1 glycosyl transferase family protein [Novosphingobium sp.]
MTGAEDWLLAAFKALALVEHELLVFAAFWFTVGLIDELGMDASYLWLRLTGRARTMRLARGYGADRLTGPVAVMIPAYREAAVIGTTITHALGVWPQPELRLYIGCYRNDPDTVAAAMAAAAQDPRVRLVIHGAAGPTTKADCLNRLYRALCDDEQRQGRRFRAVVLHDAEDMVHAAALQAIDAALGAVDFVQLPVRPGLLAHSRWIAGHYADEFTESHAKALVVRGALGAALPAAGVGCGFARAALARLAERRRAGGEVDAGPFAPECLTEDYELGLLLSAEGRGSAFLRLRDVNGDLVATSSYFPAQLDQAVRQKTRWIHGIALQGWERLGWSMQPVELWMALRDRHGPLTALVLVAAYLLLLIDGVLLLAEAWSGQALFVPLSAPARAMVALSLLGLGWRLAARLVFTTREYGLAEGMLAVLRVPVGNVIAIMAARRAVGSYFRSLGGGAVVWDKTEHAAHPAATEMAKVRA